LDDKEKEDEIVLQRTGVGGLEKCERWRKGRRLNFLPKIEG
jgi:hypothetical protein